MKPTTKFAGYSEAFIKKAGFELIRKTEEASFLRSIWMYITDSGYRKLINLQRWLDSCLDEAIEHDELHEVALSCVNASYDDTILAILKKVRSRTKYEADIKIHKTLEYWQTPIQTWKFKTGDCEDQAILILTLARLAGIPPYAIRLCCGYVNYRGRREGHAYIVYYSPRNGLPYIIDSTYYPDYTAIPQRRTWYEYDQYEDPWFGVNDQRYFGRFRIE